MKFVMFVEGYTEKKAVPAFLKRWLDSRLKQPVGIQPVRFDGWPEMIKDMANQTHRHLNNPQKRDQIIAVIALLDLYGPTIYPTHLDSADARYQWAVDDIRRKVNSDRFRMYFAVHEVEAWLLSQPNLFPKEISAKFHGKAEHPETVNFDAPPSKLLDKLYNQYLKKDYKKVVFGYALFQSLDPNVVYEKCPYFAKMMDDLLELAKNAGC